MVLVTGATGLVGSHLLLLLLENGEEVRALYRNEKNIQQTKALFEWKGRLDIFTKINWVQGCLTDIPSLEKAFENIDYVYHCAAFISFDPGDEEQMRKTNIEGTANIVNMCLSYNGNIIPNIFTLFFYINHQILSQKTLPCKFYCCSW